MQTNDRFIRLNELLTKTGLSKTTIFSLMKKGEFPKNIHITERNSAWLESEINEWMKNKIEQRQQEN